MKSQTFTATPPKGWKLIKPGQLLKKSDKVWLCPVGMGLAGLKGVKDGWEKLSHPDVSEGEAVVSHTSSGPWPYGYYARRVAKKKAAK